MGKSFVSGGASVDIATSLSRQAYIYLICRSYDIFTGHKNTQVFTFIFPYNCRAADQQKVEMDGEGGQQV